MLKVIGSPLSPYTARLRLQMAFKQCELEVIPRPGGPGSDELLALNPFGKIPVLLTPQGALIESCPLMEYLEDTHTDAPALLPGDAYQRALIRQWITAFDQYALPHTLPMFHKLFGMPVGDEQLASAQEAMQLAVGRLSSMLDGDSSTLFDELSLADCALAPFVPVMNALAQRLGIANPLLGDTRVQNWWQSFESRAEVRSLADGLTAAFDERFPSG